MRAPRVVYPGTYVSLYPHASPPCPLEDKIQTYQFREKVPVALHRLRRTFAVQIPQCASTSDNPKGGHGRNPHIQETRREVVADGAHGAPALVVTA
jgi:hypothetical protein